MALPYSIDFGPIRRRDRTGVPADHFPPRRRYMAQDHRGRVTALIAHGPEERCDGCRDAAEPCEDCVFGADHFGATGGSVSDKAWDGSASRFTDAEYQKSAAACDADDGGDSGNSVKQRCFLPHHEPSGTINSNGVHAAAQRISALKGHDAAAIDKAKAHLRSHYSKDLKEDAPKSIGGTAAEKVPVLASEYTAEYFDLAHEPFTGSHSHAHSAYGSQGGDDNHDHSHSHDGDSSHGHSHGAAVLHLLEDHEPAEAAAHLGLTVEEAGRQARNFLAGHECDHQGCQFVDGPNAGSCGCACSVCQVGMTLTAEQQRAILAELSPEQRTRALSSPALDALIADPGPGIPQIVTNPGGAWHAYLCVEGIRTDDGREIAMGATQFPDLPISLRYLKEDEGGHWGAVTCGRIDTMEMMEVDGITVCYSTGVFGSDKEGQEAQLAVEEQTQRFISIDPRDVDGQYIEIQISTSDGPSIFMDDCDIGCEVDGWFVMTSYVIGAATIVPIPALQQAVITMADQPLPLAPLATERAQPSMPVITASGAPREWPKDPPAEWFSTPPPTVGDARLVRQPDGKYAVPLQVTEEGRIFGHACYWGQEHTGMPGQKVRPPRSATYDHYMTGDRAALACSEDHKHESACFERIPVGKITMGCGHPSTSLPSAQAKAHYDGGYGAVQVADVRAVEDDFGIWLSGALCPAWSERNPGGPTPEQVGQFMSLDLSPDWRRNAGKLAMIAVLAVPVGGFPVAREALVASGTRALSEEDLAGAVRASFDGDEVTALVAAGRVHRMPMGERLSKLERLTDELYGELLERRRGEARQRLAALSE